ncbi:MAG: divalent-cation tolerance protein CutA [Pseudomonadota bacterium]
MNAPKIQPGQSGFSLLYITCADKTVAADLARLAISEKVAACANIISGMTAIYPWKGKIEESEEVVLLLKTQKALVQKLIAFIEQHHPYNVPAILEVLLGHVSAPYGAWLLQETQQQPS